MNSFDERIRERRKQDEEQMKNALEDLSSIVSGIHPQSSGFPAADQKARLAVEQILKYMGLQSRWPEEERDFETSIDFVLAPLGVMHRDVELKGKWWKNGFGAMLARNRKGEYLALIPGKMGGFLYNADIEKRWRPLKEKDAVKLRDTALLLYRPLPSKAITIREVLLFTCKDITLPRFLCLLLLLLCTSGMAYIFPELNELIISYILPMKDVPLLLGAASAGMAAFLFAWLLQVINQLLARQAETIIGTNYISAIVGRLLYLPASFFSKWSSGELGNRVMGAAGAASATVSIGLEMIFQLLIIGIGMWRIGHYAPEMVGHIRIFGVVMLVFLLVTGILQKNINTKAQRQKSKLSALVYVLFSGISRIKADGAEKRAFGKWGKEYKNLADTLYRPPVFLRISQELIGALIMGMWLVIYCKSALTGIGPAEYITFCAAFGLTIGAITSLSTCLLSITQIIPAFSLLTPILEAKPETNETKIRLEKLAGNVDFTGISFRYSEKSPWIFQDFSLSVKQGEYVAVVGRTGCGKSTLLRLLLGFEKPEFGSVFFDGQDMESLDMYSLRRHVGCVMQNGALFQDSILKNILISTHNASEEDAWEAARRAAIADDIEAMPMKMHTLISEGSGNISGGQKQRLLIARAFASKPDILLFDEATSALDNLSQKIVTDSMEKLNCTRIIIAHRLSTIRRCSRIVVLEGGKIVEDGSFEGLMEKEGVFAELMKRQME